MDDQDNIRFLNMQGEINTLKEKVSDYKMELKNAKAWIEQVSKSEAIHANTVIRLNQEFKEFKTLIEGKVKCLEDCEDLRDAQLKCLKDFIDKHLPTYIEHGGGHGGKIGVLDVPEAKK